MAACCMKLLASRIPAVALVPGHVYIGRQEYAGPFLDRAGEESNNRNSYRGIHIQACTPIMHIHTQTYICNTCMGARMYVCVCICVYVYVYVCMCVCVCMHACMHACMHVCMHACMSACLHRRVCMDFISKQIQNRNPLPLYIYIYRIQISNNATPPVTYLSAPFIPWKPLELLK